MRSLPYEAMDWADIADSTYVVGDLSSRLANDAMIDPKDYLPPFASVNIAELYDRFIPAWSRSLSTHLDCREIRAEIKTILRSNVFDAKPGAGETGAEFHRHVAVRLESRINEYENNETGLLGRTQIISSFLRDAAAWQSSQTNNALAETHNALAAAQNELTETTTNWWRRATSSPNPRTYPQSVFISRPSRPTG